MKSTEIVLGKSTISPIIHCMNPADYPDICLGVSSECNPRLIAIPERELGAGIMEIAANIKTIRQALNKTDSYQLLHILGTGNPLSMMLYYFMGADSFDGLDWCQTVVDYESATLHHSLHLDLYCHKSQLGQDRELSFLARCYMHNLEFYTIWMDKLRATSDLQERIDMIKQYIPRPQAHSLLKLLT